MFSNTFRLMAGAACVVLAAITGTGMFLIGATLFFTAAFLAHFYGDI